MVGIATQPLRDAQLPVCNNESGISPVSGEAVRRLGLQNKRHRHPREHDLSPAGVMTLS